MENELKTSAILQKGSRLFQQNFLVLLFYATGFALLAFLVSKLAILNLSAFYFFFGILGLLSTIATIEITRLRFYGQDDFSAVFPDSLKIFFDFFAVSLLFLCIIVTGLAFFLLPGFYLTLIYFFVSYVLVDRKARGVDAFMHAKALMKGRVMQVLVPFCVVLTITILLQFLFLALIKKEHYVLRYFFDFLISAFCTSCFFVMYRALESTAPNLEIPALSKRQKLIFILKYSIIPLLIFFSVVYFKSMRS